MSLPTTPTTTASGHLASFPDDSGAPTSVLDPPTAQLDNLESAAWEMFSQCRHDLVAALEHDLESTPLSLGDFQVLVALSRADEQAMRMCDLADDLHLSPSGLTRRLDGLVNAGLVERRNSKRDGRVMLAVVTPAGRRAFDHAMPVHVGSVRSRVTGLLTDDELQAMAAIFGKIRLALDAQRES